MSFTLERRQADAAQSKLALARSRIPELGAPSSIAPLEPALEEVLRLKLRNRVHGVFPSAKNGSSIPWAWREQRDLMFLLELDTAVVSYEAMNEQVSLFVNGSRMTHLPAFRVRTPRGNAVVDGVSSQWASSRTGSRTLGAVAEAYAERGIPYIAVVSRDIRMEPRAGNARWVLAHKAQLEDAQAELQVRWALSSGSRRIDEVEAMLPGAENVVATVCLMAVQRQVKLDLSAVEPRRMVANLQREDVR